LQFLFWDFRCCAVWVVRKKEDWEKASIAVRNWSRSSVILTLEKSTRRLKRGTVEVKILVLSIYVH
jgi:hypothetical protein